MWSPALLLGYTCGHRSLLWWPDTASDFLSIARRGPAHLATRYSDAQGNHAMCCGSGGERISRHNHLRDHLHDNAVGAGLGPVREVRFLILGEDSRPADVLLPHWIGGKDAALDVTVVNPCQAATVIGAATTAGHALNFAHSRKVRGAGEACQRQGVTFLPIVVESLVGGTRRR